MTMNKGLLCGLALIAGGAAGFFGARSYFSSKYEALYQKDIESLREQYAARSSTLTRKQETTDMEIKKKAEQAKTKPELTRYVNYARQLGYREDEQEKPEPEIQKGEPVLVLEKAEAIANPKRPYVVPPDEYGTFDNFETISLTLYADHILADDDDRQISQDEIEHTVGSDSLTHFGEYEEDSVFVRNEELKCDYEILLSQKEYSEVLKEKPYLQDD
jgi:hypothetical protein